MSDEHELDITCKRASRNGTMILTAKLGGECLLTDKIDISRAASRKRFVEGLCRDRPGIQSDVVENRLEELAGELVERKPDEEPSGSHADALVELARDAELFHTGDADDDGYATIPVDDHRETWAIASKGFKDWLRRRFWEENHSVPSAASFQDALAVIMAKARFEGPVQQVSVRLAGDDRNIWLDLGDPRWRAVHITPRGWEIVENPPLRFRRPRGMLALPEPVHGGSLAELRPFVNVGDRADDRGRDGLGRKQWVLLLAWLVAALRPRGPYPVLDVNGEQGSAKTTLSRLLRTLLDPNRVPLRSPPHEEQDLVLAAKNGHVLGLDNLSNIPPWLSDALCRISTGTGFSKRRLYTDDDEALFEATRPILVNGIEDLLSRGDLIDRAIRLTLPAIPDDQRRTEEEFWRAFEDVRPRVLGALLTAVSRAMDKVSSVSLPKKARMADFCVWAVAAEKGLGLEEGEFLKSYQDNRDSTVDQVIDDSPIGPAILKLCQTLKDAGSPWEGSPTELLNDLAEHYTDEATRKRRDWPKSGKGISNALRRLAPQLRKRGIEVVFPEKNTREGHDRKRVLTISKSGAAPSASTANPQSPQQQETECGRNADGTRTELPEVRMELSSTRTELPAMRTVADDTRSEDRPHLSPKNRISKTIEGGADGTVPGLDNEALDEFEEGTI